MWVAGVVEAAEGVATGAVLFPLLLYGFLVRDAGALQGGSRYTSIKEKVNKVWR